MKYREGEDYWVRFVEFPNRASPSVAVSNGDGTFTIYINTRFSPERQAEGLRHELTHLEREHFYRDDRELWELEAEADGLLMLPPPEKCPAPAGRKVPLYSDADEFLRDFLHRASPDSIELLHRAGLLPVSVES